MARGEKTGHYAAKHVSDREPQLQVREALLEAVPARKSPLPGLRYWPSAWAFPPPRSAATWT